MQFAEQISEKALELGFIAVGFCHSGRPPFIVEYNHWVDAGKYGEMEWLKRHKALKSDPENLLEGCRSIISLGYPYPSQKPCTPDGLTAARYSRPDKTDYHGTVRERANPLVEMITRRYPRSRCRICVDSAPILERGFAYVSGLGFIGKNNMLIRPGHGSYLFLGEILTTAPLKFAEPVLVENGCGACTRCLGACPTGALESPFSMNAGKCLSYLTIEKKGPIDRETAENMIGCFFGCDVCQEVCPYNSGTSEMLECLPSSDELLSLTSEAFEHRFGGTAFARAGIEKIRGNLMVMLKAAPPPIS